MPAGQLEISRATEAELPWCANVMATTDPWIALGRRYEDCLARLRRPEPEVLVARRQGQPLGFMILHPTGVAGSPYVAAIAVAAEGRSAGTGTALLRYAEGHFPEARHIFLCVSDFNLRARALYERLGYRAVGVLPDYAIDGKDEILMHKRLVRA
jgi:ribosomal protein S18 acetylase RimI-like enzyme